MALPKRYILLTLCLLFACVTRAQERENASLELVGGTDGTLEAVFHCGRPMVSHVDGHCSVVTVEGMNGDNGLTGQPALPSMSCLVQLPRGSRLTLTAVRGEEMTWDSVVDEGWPLLPVAGATVKDALPPTCVPDEKTYHTDGWYRGGEPVEVEPLGTMGGTEVYRLTVRPVAYNPVRRSLRYYSALTATLESTPSSLLMPDASLPERYLIVSRPEFREGLQPFVRWKRQEGYDVVELYAGTHLRDSVKALVHSEFGSGRSEAWPRYILLVGDVEQIQAFQGTTRPEGLGSHITDLYYAEHTGDWLPDALIGRWPVGDTAGLRAVVEKTLRYEQGLDLDTARLRRVLLVAGTENQAPAPVTTNGQVNYLAREIKSAHPALDTVCYRNPASAGQRAAILGDVRHGAALINYTAHCSTGGWSTPSVSFSALDTLDNPQPLLYVNNCCLSNDFGGTCFGEQLLRKPVGGAIGVIGATNSTLWNEDYYWAVGPKYPFALNPVYDPLRPGAFDNWLGRGDGVHTQGELLVAGNLAVTAFGSPYSKFYWEIYCLFGDPSLRPWVGAPQSIELCATNGIHDGDATLHLGGTAGATVTAMQHDTVIGVGVIGTNGLLALDMVRCLDTAPLIVTATGDGLLPRVDTLTVDTIAGIGVALREVTVTDSAVTCRVENVGTVPLYGLRVVLGQLDADSAVDALVTEQQTVVDTLLPHQRFSLALPVQVTAVGQYPYWQAQLFVWDSNEGMLCSLNLRQPMEVDYPELSVRLMESSGIDAHRLLPRHDYLLETTVAGNADDANLMFVATALPTGDILVASCFSDSYRTFPIQLPDTLTHLHLEAALQLGNHTATHDWWLVGGERLDSFEEGLASYPWQGGGTRPWILDSAVTYRGRYSMRSGAIDYRQTSDLILEVLLPQRDTLSYWARTSSEAQYDMLLLLVDGVKRGSEMWGESGWKHCTTVLDAGRHELRWRYVKDESGTAGSDCAWIDDVRLPLALWDSAYGWFGDPAVLGLPQAASEPRLTVYPNPASGHVTVAGIPDGGRMLLYDMQGRQVYATTDARFPITDIPDGVYLLQVVTAAERHHCKLIIRH